MRRTLAAGVVRRQATLAVGANVWVRWHPLLGVER